VAIMEPVEEGVDQPQSRALWEESLDLMPDGVAGDGQYWAPYPIFFDRADGARMWDVDGREYLDFICGNGAIILGHRHPAVVEAITDFMAHWPPNLTPNPYTLELAQLIHKYIPSLEKMRFVPSASEAVHIALRVARAFTGRAKTAEIEGGFYGQVEEALVSTWPNRGRRGARKRPLPQPSSAGLNPGTLENTVLIPWNDADAAVEIIEEHAHELASLILEPVLGVGGALPADQAFMDTLREVTARHEIVLIFDETVTGFRYHLGGAQAMYDIMPDMTILGKVIGGGFPLAVFGGSNTVMSVVGRAGGKSLLTQAYQSGTFGGFALGCAAGTAVIRTLEEQPVHEHINRVGERLREGMREISSIVDVPMQVTGVGPMFNAFFTEQPVRDVRDANDVDPGKRIGTAVHNQLLRRGIRALRNHYSLACFAHTDSDVDQLLSALEDVLREMRAAGTA
jgi:glutamate-1-semialdehyde 2,1-aminomutase